MRGSGRAEVTVGGSGRAKVTVRGSGRAKVTVGRSGRAIKLCIKASEKIIQKCNAN